MRQDLQAVIYCRVSTDDQEKEGTSLQTQMDACLAYCQDKGYKVSQRFSETYSGLTLDRSKLKELRELLRTGNIDVIVIYCLDRISRDPTHGVILTQEFEKLGVALEAVTEDVDNTELGKLISYIRGFASKLEAEKIRERTMRGKMAHLKNGRLPQGTGIGVYGYNWDKSAGRRTIIDHEAVTVRKIFNMAISGISINRIAMTLNESDSRTKSGSLWHRQTVKRVLSNPVYTGKTYFGQTKRINKTKVEAQPEENWILLPEITPPIITDEIFNQAQEALINARQARPLRPNSSYLLTGFIRCSKCGSTIFGTTLEGKYRYYRCFGSIPTVTRGKISDARYINADEIEGLVWDKIVKLYSSPLTLLSMFTNLNYDSKQSILPLLDRQIKRLRNKLKTYSTKEKNLYDLLSNEAVTKDYVIDAVNKLKLRQQEDEHQLKQLLESRKQHGNAIKITGKLTELSDALQNSLSDNMSLDEKRITLESLGVMIQAWPGDYKFTCFIDAELTSDYDQELESAFYEEAKKLEAKHPELTIGDLFDYNTQVPDDTLLGQAINKIKNRNNDDLVISSQTSRCLRSSR
ncbi:recombinase family protein [Chloroflexota bacterium]